VVAKISHSTDDTAGLDKRNGIHGTQIQTSGGKKGQLKQICSPPVLLPFLEGPPRTEHLVSTYFDTSELIFHEEGLRRSKLL
jgi:hypothetical protein